MRFTVFTPTYNRAHTLERVYKSLECQSYQDFEWIVIDDGSIDETEKMISFWKEINKNFDIVYRRVKNGGKHRAINRAVQLAQGELFFIVDSDDYLPIDGLKIVDQIEKSIALDKKNMFAGVCGLDIYSNGEIVGTTYSGTAYLDIPYLDSAKYNIKGDKKEVFYTRILKEFPFPEYEGENFVSEALVWGRMARAGYKLRYFNKPIYIVEYQKEGISNNLDDIQKKSPKGWALFINEQISNMRIPHKEIIFVRLWYYQVLKDTLTIKEICNNLKITKGTLRFYILYRFCKRVLQKLDKLIKRISLGERG